MLPGTQAEGADSGPYNRTMLQSLNALLAPALMERLVLVINHVLGAEPAATQRLRAHDQRVIELQMQGWPSLLPAPPTLVFRITPAGMLTLTVLKPQPERTFALDSFLTGNVPSAADVLLEQRLVSVSR